MSLVVGGHAMRRVTTWRAEAAITDGVLFRRVGVERRRKRSKELADTRGRDRHGRRSAAGNLHDRITPPQPSRHHRHLSPDRSGSRRGRAGRAPRWRTRHGDCGIVDPSLSRRADSGYVRGRRGRFQHCTDAPMVVTIDGAAIRAETAGSERCRGPRPVSGAIVIKCGIACFRHGTALMDGPSVAECSARRVEDGYSPRQPIIDIEARSPISTWSQRPHRSQQRRLRYQHV